MSTKDEDEGGGQIMPIAAILQQIGRGTAHAELSEELQDLVVAVADLRKKGTLTITLTVEPMKGASENLQVSVKYAVKKPQEPKTSVFFSDDAGNLSREDPRQLKANLHEVGTARKGETA